MLSQISKTALLSTKNGSFVNMILELPYKILLLKADFTWVLLNGTVCLDACFFYGQIKKKFWTWYMPLHNMLSDLSKLLMK